VTLERNDWRMLSMGIGIVLFSLALAGILGKPATGGGGGPPPAGEWVLTSGQNSFTGTGNENTDTTFNMDINVTNLANVTVKLTWTDEPDITNYLGRHTNQPDELGVTAGSPEGESQEDFGQNAHGASGSVEVGFKYNVTEKTAPRKFKDGMGNWTFAVHVGACGDQTPAIGPGVIRTIADNSNAFTLTVSYSYYTFVKPAGAK